MLRAPDSSDSCRRFGGFSLVELLVVIGLLSALIALGYTGLRGSKRQASVDQARAELAVLGQLLDAYRRTFGDYPQGIESSADLYRTLTGRRGSAGEPSQTRDLTGGVNLTLSDPEHPDDPANRWVDPWRRDYGYVAYTRTRGTLPPLHGFVLFSPGDRPPGTRLPAPREIVPEVMGERGGVISTSPINASNLYLVR